MGQYHYVANLDKKQYLHPHRFDDGLKLMEFGASPGGTMTALAILLAEQSKDGGRGGGDIRHDAEGLVGSWSGDRIAIVGDYAEPADRKGGWDDENNQPLYATLGGWIGDNETDTGWIEISSVVIPLLKADGCYSGRE
jgi:hypothetical protein